MTDLKKYASDAEVTESKIDSVIVNEDFLLDILCVMINAGNILDQIKKHVYYGNEYDLDDIKARSALLTRAGEELNKYAHEDAVATNEIALGVDPRVFHAIVGIATESTELLEALDLSGRPMDRVNIGEEFADIDWYKAIGVNALELNWDTLLKTNIKKLRNRYKDKFDAHEAKIRDLGKEREILETMED